MGTQTPPTRSEGIRQIEPSGTRRQIPQVQIQITSESVLFLPLSFFALEEYVLIQYKLQVAIGSNQENPRD